MRSMKNMADQPAAIPLLADDLLEFHASRILLLFKVCGIKGRIDGLTKMAKLDFFVRYPSFFVKACKKLGVGVDQSMGPIESTMVRYHYGPWDQRYYHVLGYLKATGLMEVSQEGNKFVLMLTDKGQNIATELERGEAFQSICERMKQVKKAFGNRSGSRLKKLIYEIFDAEVAKLSHGETIE